MLEKDNALLRACFDAWAAGAELRARRQRYKGFAYGRQWDDPVRTPDGRRLTERDAMMEQGRVPVTNNLIRQLLKSIVGRYRQMTAPGPDGDIYIDCHGEEQPDRMRMLARELDARALEEFLISGCVIQRCGYMPGMGPQFDNVSLDRFFYHRFLRTDGSDCRFMGMLHDMPLITVAKGFAKTTDDAAAILEAYKGAEGRVDAAGLSVDFSSPSLPGHVRVIEVWRLQTALYTFVTIDDDDLPQEHVFMSAEAAARYAARAAKINGAERVHTQRRLDDQWIQTFMTPRGQILDQQVMDRDRVPFVMCFYPLIDGEVHSLVEDVIDQQKYINRLVTLLDDIMASSAKGVLLFPTEQLPEGFTWRDIRRIWGSPNAVVPYRNTRHGKPEQVSTGGVHGGADRMLDLQLRLFDEISGAGGAIRGRSSTAQGAEMLRQELEAGTISMLDLLATFSAFAARRDEMIFINQD